MMMRRIQRWLWDWAQDHLGTVLNLYPPYVGAGIRVKEIASDYRSVRVEMGLSFYNRNYFGTHFGGSLYAMCDPFFVLMVTRNLGPGYIVWDKEARIRFLRPGTGTVEALFEISEEQLAELRSVADDQGRAEKVFRVDVTNADGQTVAHVDKRIYVRRK